MSRNNVWNWTEEDLATYLARFDRPAVSAPDVEPDSSDEPARADAAEEVHPRFSITIYSKRRRLCDADGISAKFAIDGLVQGGLLRDDGPQIIKEVTFSQEKSAIEETIIELWQLTPADD